ncbi:unnamed protein product [Parnassius apollo]|uniref:RING-type E3 ubiquitin transferase n=1 Tax=Parnassius apollo TaxID=110799 RepID=A0A8S3Y9B9_PARAO|nr:unnamed protein product [Parnassius apollo]
MDFNRIVDKLESTDWSLIMNMEDANEAADNFYTILETAINENTSYVVPKRSDRVIKPWITPGLMRCQKHRDNLHLEARRNPYNTFIQITYKRYRNFLYALQRKLKTEYENNQIQQNKDNPKKLWKSLKNICNLTRNTTEATELLSVDKDPDSSLNACNEYFTRVGRELADDTLRRLNTQEDLLAAEYKPRVLCKDSLFLQPTDPYEVGTLIDQLKNDTAPGGLPDTDRIHYYVALAPVAGCLVRMLDPGLPADHLKKATKAVVYEPLFRIDGLEFMLGRSKDKQFSFYDYPDDVTSDELKAFEAVVNRLRVAREAVVKVNSPGSSGTQSELLCTICYARPADTAFVPCGHHSCRPCIMQHLLNSKQCFFCKADIESVREIEPANN